MMRSQQGIPYAKDLTPKNRLTKDNLDHLAELERQALEASRSKTPASRKNLQMSIRMGQEDYLRFRAVCRALRKTNGDMLTELLAMYLDQVPSGSPSEINPAPYSKTSWSEPKPKPLGVSGETRAEADTNHDSLGSNPSSRAVTRLIGRSSI